MHPDLVHVRLLDGERVIHSYGALLVLGVAAGIALTVLRARRFGLDRFDALAIGLFALAGGLAGATLLYIVVHWRQMLHEPALLLHPGLVFYGGLAGGTFGAAVYCRLYRLSLLRAGDCAVPGLALGHALGRVGCFLAGCCYGKPVAPAFPLAVTMAGTTRHPVQLYEAAGLLVLMTASLIYTPRRPGQLLALYLAGYALLRLFTESLRGDDEARGFVIAHLLSTSQAVALVMVVVAVVLVYRQPAQP